MTLEEAMDWLAHVGGRINYSKADGGWFVHALDCTVLVRNKQTDWSDQPPKVELKPGPPHRYAAEAITEVRDKLRGLVNAA